LITNVAKNSFRGQTSFVQLGGINFFSFFLIFFLSVLKTGQKQSYFLGGICLKRPLPKKLLVQIFSTLL
jgi:hypothetical protein